VKNAAIANTPAAAPHSACSPARVWQYQAATMKAIIGPSMSAALFHIT
jgi:hypothetical protein